jgi:hypothetical protein
VVAEGAEDVTVADVLYQCLRHFAHLDEANAAIHCAEVRYSPITFRLADTLDEHFIDTGEWPPAGVEADEILGRVLNDVGKYTEDPGR